MILGILESKGAPQISISSQVLEFKQHQNIWLNISQNNEGTLSLKDLLVCEYKYTTVLANFITYPILAEGQLLSTNTIRFGELLESGRNFSGQGPILKDHELVMTEDLTDNDLVIRQINSAHIVQRLLKNSLKNQGAGTQPFQFSSDYYGDSKYWRRTNILMKLILFCFLLLCVTQRLLIKSFLFLTSLLPLQKINLMLQLRRKVEKYDQAKRYFEMLL